MFRIILACFLISSVFAQDNKINQLDIDSRDNGTIIKLKSTKKVDLKNITAWYSSEWFNLTIYDAKSDSTKLANTPLNKIVRKIEVLNSDESTQIALQVNESIESFEIMSPSKREVSFILRFPQEEIKSDLSDNNLEELIEVDEIKTSKKSLATGEMSKASKFMPFVGLVVAASDITNPAVFLGGTLISLLSLFL